VPLLMVLLSDDPDAERDPKRWKVQQPASLALSRIYSESRVWSSGRRAEPALSAGSPIGACAQRIETLRRPDERGLVK
jgi:hypothetical protein